MNRREFLKVTGATTAVAGLALATQDKPGFALNLGKEQEKFPMKITEDFRGFKQKDVIFMRMFWDDSPLESYIQDTFGVKTFKNNKFINLQDSPYYGAKGFREVDKALSDAAWSSCNSFAPMSSLAIKDALIFTHACDPTTGQKMMDKPVAVKGMHSWDNSKVDMMLMQGGKPVEFKDRKEATSYVKRAARVLGADLVGIVPFDERSDRWTYTEWSTPKVKVNHMPNGSSEYGFFDMEKAMRGEDPIIGLNTIDGNIEAVAGFKPKSVIVVAFEMDYDAIKTAPTVVSGVGSGFGYSQMSETVHKIAEFLRNMGYKAIPCGNDTSLSVPLAIEAGLGESSRMGLLVTEKYGPRVRLAKVYTDLELDGDKPITFGVKEFCNVCMKCADACPSKAIGHEPAQVLLDGMEFSTGKVNSSTMVGVEKWFVNAERCNAFWTYSGGDCQTCLAVCPYNKIDEWHHDLSKLMTLTPFKALLRKLDESFGYGGPVEPETRIESKYLEDAVDDFWNKI